MEVLSPDKVGKPIKGYCCRKCGGTLFGEDDGFGQPIAKCLPCSRSINLKRQKRLWKPKELRGNTGALH